jgi:hypothetical protein
LSESAKALSGINRLKSKNASGIKDTDRPNVRQSTEINENIPCLGERKIFIRVGREYFYDDYANLGLNYIFASWGFPNAIKGELNL